MNTVVYVSFLGILLGIVSGVATAELVPALGDDLDFFPVATQFSPVPSGKGWKGEEGALSEEMLRDTVDNIIAHGFTGIESNTHRPEPEQTFILDYARSRGMFITAHVGALEGFGRDAPPSPSVYSPEYGEAVRSRAKGT